MLQESEKSGGESDSHGGHVGKGVTVYFICADALAIYHEVTSRGVEASNPFVGNNMWVTSLVDPDGYQLAFESPTDVPEETVYSAPQS